MATAFKDKSTEELASARDKLDADIAGFTAKLDAAGTKGSMASKKADVGSQLEAHSGLRDKIQKELDDREFEAPSEPERPAHERLDPSRQWMGLEDPKMAPKPPAPEPSVVTKGGMGEPEGGFEGVPPGLLLAGELAASFTKADIPISAAYLAKAIKEKDVIGIALSGMGIIPGLGPFGKLLKAIKAGDRSVDTLRAAEKALDDPATKEAVEAALKEAKTAAREWAPKTKVVDEAGEPMVVYHGTYGEEFEEFQISEGVGAFLGEGVYATRSKPLAEAYAGMAFPEGYVPKRPISNPRVLPLNVNIENPYEIVIEEGSGSLGIFNRVVDEDLMQLDGVTDKDIKKITDTLKKQGYDGVIAYKRLHTGEKRAEEIVAFSAEQVRQIGLPIQPAKTAAREVSRWKNMTPAEQKGWFGDSKVADKAGEPMVVYHGTIHEFPIEEIDTLSDMGAHFGTADQAGYRAKVKAEAWGQPGAWKEPEKHGPRVIPVYLNIKNPYRMPDMVDEWDAESVARHIADDPDLDWSHWPAGPEDLIDSAGYDSGPVQSFLRKNGYDGIVYKNRGEGSLKGQDQDSWIVFDANQVKSAIASPAKTAAREVSRWGQGGTRTFAMLDRQDLKANADVARSKPEPQRTEFDLDQIRLDEDQTLTEASVFNKRHVDHMKKVELDSDGVPIFEPELGPAFLIEDEIVRAEMVLEEADEILKRRGITQKDWDKHLFDSGDWADAEGNVETWSGRKLHPDAGHVYDLEAKQVSMKRWGEKGKKEREEWWESLSPGEQAEREAAAKLRVQRDKLGTSLLLASENHDAIMNAIVRNPFSEFRNEIDLNRSKELLGTLSDDEFYGVLNKAGLDELGNPIVPPRTKEELGSSFDRELLLKLEDASKRFSEKQMKAAMQKIDREIRLKRLSGEIKPTGRPETPLVVDVSGFADDLEKTVGAAKEKAAKQVMESRELGLKELKAEAARRAALRPTP